MKTEDVKTNPYAFPVPDSNNEWCGMRLKDYFAAAALTGMLASGTFVIPEDLELIAAYSYRAARRMLAERAMDL